MLYEQSWKQDIPAPKLCIYRVSSSGSSSVSSSSSVSYSSVSSNSSILNYSSVSSAVSSILSATARRERNCERHSSNSYEHEN